MSDGLYEPGPGVSSDLQKFVKVFTPYAVKTDAGKELRKEAFRNADPNGNGVCSLAELETWVLSALIHAHNSREEGQRLFDLYRPSYIRAFANAKDMQQHDGQVLTGTDSATQDDFVSFVEFRLWIANLCCYAGMYDAFAKLDGGKAGRDENDDLRIELSEWTNGYAGVRDHGFVAFEKLLSEADAQAVFDKMDNNKGGMVTLEEWCNYIKREEISAKTKMGTLLCREMLRTNSPVRKQKVPRVAELHKSRTVKAFKPRKDGLYAPGPSASSELRDFVQVFTPFAVETNDGKRARKSAFHNADPNGNGFCSLAELESWVLRTLKDAHGRDEGPRLFNLFRPSYIRAFTNAKDVHSNNGKVIAGTESATHNDFVTFAEFRLWNAYLCMYAGIYDVFSKIDGGRAGRDENDDLRIELSEFINGYAGGRDHGFVAFSKVETKADAEDVFETMDVNKGGMVTLGEWCDYVKEEEIKASTEMGKLLKMG